MSERKKLFICCTAPDFITNILKDQPFFLNRYFDVSIVTGSRSFIDNSESYESVPIHRVAFHRKIHIIYDILTLLQLIFLLLKERPNIVHSYTPKAGLLVMVAAWCTGVPIRIHSFTGLLFPSRMGFEKFYLKLIDKIICYYATSILPEGIGVRNDLLDNKITSKELIIVGNGNVAGIDLDHFDDSVISNELAISELQLKGVELNRNVVYCFIGRLNEDKGLSELYFSFVKLPEDTILLIAGALDVYGKPISEFLLNKYRLHPRIFLLGFVRDVRLVLKLSDFLVLPSYREGFPNVLLQSLAMRIPAIATDINGCNEIITNDLNGWLVNSRNVEELFWAMQKAYSLDDYVLNNMKNICRSSIFDRFEQSLFRQKLVDYYTSIV